MNPRELKHMARLTEWKERVAACRSSGMSVRAWCREQGIANKTYYYWEKEILSEAGRQMAALERESQFVKVPALPKGLSVSDGGSALAAKLRMRDGELEIYAGADGAVVETLLRALKNAE